MELGSDSPGGCPAAFSPDGKWLAVSSPHSIDLFSMDKKEKAASLYFFGESDWLIVTPDGLFDGTPGAWPQLAWRFSESTFDLDPIEIFFREYFRPGLLSDMLASNRIEPAPAIEALDRRQPKVEISPRTALSSALQERGIILDLKVTEDKSGSTSRGSGARDLRLFRNGTLIKVWRGDLVLDADGKVTVTADVAMSAGTNKFSAYVFNRANIKSADASFEVEGGEALRRGGTAYVLAIGVNRYVANTAARPMNLDFA